MPPEDESEVLTPPRKTHIDVVHSEDIDGPTDFTQNLEYWMTAKLPNVTRPSHMTGQARDDLEEYVSEETETQVRSPQRVEEVKKDSLMDTDTPRKDDHGMSFLSNIPSSLHAEDAQSSTPKTVEHVSAATGKEFQASVEDHDDTPSRMQSSSAIGATLRSPEFTLKSRPDYFTRESDKEDEESKTVRSLREALSKLREELDDVRESSQQEITRVKADFEQQAEKQRYDQHIHMQAKEQEWRQKLSAAQADHAEKLSAALSTAGEDSAQNNKQLQLTHELELSRLRQSISDLEFEAGSQAKRYEAAEEKAKRAAAERDAALENQRAIMDMQKSAQHRLETERQAWQEERSGFQAAKQEVQTKIESLQAEVANLTLEHANEIDELTLRIDDAANATQRAVLEQRATADATIRDLEQENNRLHNQLDNKDDDIAALRDELLEVRLASKDVVEEKDKVLAKLEHQKSLNDQAAREIQSLRSGNKILQSKLEDAQAVDTEAVVKLEEQLAEANAARLESDAEVDEVKSKLDEAKTSLATAQNETIIAREELARYKEDSELVNKAMDKRLGELMRARELEWARRLAELKKEMGLRGEVLMREWGRAEMGLSEPQPYRYKFV